MKYRQQQDGTFAVIGLTFKQYTALVQHITAQKMMFRWPEEEPTEEGGES